MTLPAELRAEAERETLVLGLHYHPEETRALLHRAADALEWRDMATCPKDEDVLLWNEEWEEVSIGYQPEDAPEPNDVVVSRTQSWADKWRPLDAPLPATPEGDHG